ncbi:MAG: hypothetical protein IM638_16670 [Bacteroidetes bacterium]|nr:hypothetical protein [Bacteroidota bacterium]
MNTTANDKSQEECLFCFADKVSQDVVCSVCLFPLQGGETEQKRFFEQHAALRKSILVSAWWINLAQQFVLGAALGCVANISLTRGWHSLTALLLYGLAGSFNLVMYFLPNRFTQVSAAVAGTVGVLFIAAAFWLHKLNLWSLAFSTAYVVVMAVTFYRYTSTAVLLRMHWVRGGNADY